MFSFFVIHKLNLFSNIKRQKNSFYGKETCAFDPNFQDVTLIYLNNIFQGLWQADFLGELILLTKNIHFFHIFSHTSCKLILKEISLIEVKYYMILQKNSNEVYPSGFILLKFI